MIPVSLSKEEFEELRAELFSDMGAGLSGCI
jgi:hypothetical protein